MLYLVNVINLHGNVLESICKFIISVREREIDSMDIEFNVM